MMKRALAAALLAVVAVPLLAAVAALPPHGSRWSPAYTHVASWYLERGAEEAGSENIVTGVILNYRGFDTDWEVAVIFTAFVGASVVLLGGSRVADASRVPRSEVGVSLVVRFVVRMLAPFIAVFGTYVMSFGHVSPGGGFQGGTILAALVIVTTVIVDTVLAQRMVPSSIRPWLQGAAPLAFVAVGLIGLGLTGYYLGFPAGSAPAWVTTSMLTVIEFGIGVGGAAIFASLFWLLEGSR